MSTPVIAVTMGDPAGIGPEVVLKALAEPGLRDSAHWIVVGDRTVLGRASALTGVPLPDVRFVEPGPLLAGFQFGRLSAECGRAGLAYVRAATELCLAREADAMVTAPLNKEAVVLSGEAFTGHTEFIARLCGAKESRMLLASERLRVVHVSTHVPLRQACALDPAHILRTIELGHEAIRLMGFDCPRIAVCGLNPHAGEHGLFGEEDERFIAPAVRSAHASGLGCDGPFPADTVFLKAARGAYDLVVAMYHDQGHIPMKLLDFEHTVNVSLGLPIIRTSVDHGTAFDIAGRNLADPGSMQAALKLAAVMARHRGEPRR